VAPAIEKRIAATYIRVAPAKRRGHRQHTQGGTNKENRETSNNNQGETCDRLEKTLKGQRQQKAGEVNPQWL
jgi:hypothetical protein